MYPYNVIQVVQGPESFGGGMEYPTITVISPGGSKQSLDHVIAHELGHNWFYGILGSNERDHPWMDEGINSYYDHTYLVSKYGKQPQLERIAFETRSVTKTDQPIEGPAEHFNELNYGLVVYYKTSEWMRYLEQQLGTDVFNKAMQDYYRDWQFKHPQPEDFKHSIETSSGRNLDTVFSYLNKTGLLPNQQRSGSKTIFLFDIKQINEYAKEPAKNVMLLGPAIGFNSYDKLMAGVFVTNLKLPPSHTQFLLASMYGTGSKRIVGLGFISHSFYSGGLFRKIDLGVGAAKFTSDRFISADNQKTFMGFRKIVPGIKFTFREKNPLSTFTHYVKFRTFLISEESLRFYRDTVITPGTPPDTTIFDRYRTREENRTLNQLLFVIENHRVLYPYRAELKLEQAKNLYRAAFTANYFFNYPKEGGFDIRLFAGKFFYRGPKTFGKQFATARYHLNMTGPNGYEDYTYSDYFLGRNLFEGLASQQIMMRDGAFKVRTELLASKVGKTDDWLVAANFSSTLPSGLNPLSILPFKIPLKIFVDVGTYSEAWEKDSENDHFLFDAGLHIPLFAETVNIYVPVIYSEVFKSYIQSTLPKKGRFFKLITFSIDISRFNFRKIDNNLGL
jgi:hypothetical protein